MTGRIVILSGPSGVGKDTVLAAWTARNPRVRRVVATTTRAPRPGETDGVDYTFVSRERFMALAESGAFLEWKEVHGNLYATPLESLERMLSEGLVAILKIDVQGALTAMEKRPDAVSIFLMPPSMAELERRIRARGSDNAEAIQVRLQNARDEIEVGKRYRHRVVNDDVERCVDRLEAILE
ncbi:MAG: guanylate kinase [Fimbriimonadaceae bacterium]|nr:guanylate kinase [Fimbriimonadaceae bacterium]